MPVLYVFVLHFQQNGQYEFAVYLYLKFRMLFLTNHDFAFHLHNDKADKALYVRQKPYTQTKNSQRQKKAYDSLPINRDSSVSCEASHEPF